MSEDVTENQTATVVEDGQSNPMMDQVITDQMQAELLGLMQAWVDRGIPVGGCAELMAATAHVMLAMGGYPMSQLLARIIRQWDQHGGQP